MQDLVTVRSSETRKRVDDLIRRVFVTAMLATFLQNISQRINSKA